MTTDAIARDAEHARHVYGDRVVDKRLANEEVFARLPRYVTEYLIAKFVKPGREEEGVAAIKERIKGRIPEADQKEIIKGRLLRDGSYVVIDQLEAEIDLTAGRPWARLNCLHNETLAIDAGLVERFEPLLNGGLWGTVTVTYDAGRVPRLAVADFTPFQVARADVAGLRAGRTHFTTDEWTRLLLRSAGYEPSSLTVRQQWLLLARLVPLVERNVNLI